jgi:hypothetical protein
MQERRIGRKIRKSAGFHQQTSVCNPAEIQTELARSAAFDQIAADRCFASGRLSKVDFACGTKEKSPTTFQSSGSYCNPAASYFPTASRQQ